MRTQRLTSLFAALGISAVIAAAAIVAAHPDAASPRNVAGGSGDSSTTGSYVSPTVPTMAFDPTAMSMGATATAGPATSLATSIASPTLKASAAAGCVNNGQCP